VHAGHALALHVGASHVPRVHTLLAQSALALQPSPPGHLPHVGPPQSGPVSAPFLTASVHVGSRQTRVSRQIGRKQGAPHDKVAQSVPAWQVSPATQRAQSAPPQSTSVSSESLVRLEQCAGRPASAGGVLASPGERPPSPGAAPEHDAPPSTAAHDRRPQFSTSETALPVVLHSYTALPLHVRAPATQVSGTHVPALQYSEAAQSGVCTHWVHAPDDGLQSCPADVHWLSVVQLVKHR
jgi:hypothetical protein